MVPRRSVSQAFLLDLLGTQLAEVVPGEWRALDVIDLGGGTGLVATALAGDGHQVTVIDPSPDALASLERRTAESGLSGRIRARQGDAGELVALVGAHAADLVVCHRVLEVVDSPDDALAAMRQVLRPGGLLSLLVAQRHSAVLSQALAGHVALARRTWSEKSRFDYRRVTDLVHAAGFTVLASHGVGAVADHVPEALLDSEPGSRAELAALETEVSADPAFRAVAPHLHVFAQAPVAL